MAELAWKRMHPNVEEAEAPNGATFVITDQPGFFDVTFYHEDKVIELPVGESRLGARNVAAKLLCQRLTDWAVQTAGKANERLAKAEGILLDVQVRFWHGDHHDLAQRAADFFDAKP